MALEKFILMVSIIKHWEVIDAYDVGFGLYDFAWVSSLQDKTIVVKP